MDEVIIYGAGPYGEIFFHDLKNYGFNILRPVAFTVDAKYKECSEVFGLPVIVFEEVEKIFPPTSFKMIVICGYTRMRNRKEMFDKAIKKGYTLTNYFSPMARIDETSVVMGVNNVVLAGAEIGHGGRMGNNNFINQNCYIAHNFNIHDHNIFSANCVIGGFCDIGSLNFFGYSVTASGFKRFGDEVLVGMGSVITKDVPSFAKVYGNPAKLISYHHDSGVIIREGGLFRYDDKIDKVE